MAMRRNECLHKCLHASAPVYTCLPRSGLFWACPHFLLCATDSATTAASIRSPPKPSWRWQAGPPRRGRIARGSDFQRTLHSSMRHYGGAGAGTVRYVGCCETNAVGSLPTMSPLFPTRGLSSLSSPEFPTANPTASVQITTRCSK